jgi:hypothetical protein
MRWGNWLIGSCCAAYIIAALTPTGLYSGIWKLSSGKDAAAWVQAFGSLLALAIAIAVPAWLSLRTEARERKREADQAAIVHRAAYAALSEAYVVLAYLYQSTVRPRLSVDHEALAGMARDALKAITAIDLHAVPSPTVMATLKVAKISLGSAEQLVGLVADTLKVGPPTAAQVATLRAKAEGLAVMLNKVGEELPASERPNPELLDNLIAVREHREGQS